MILAVAVQGRLERQSEKDESAALLLNRIRDVRKKKPAKVAGTVRKLRPLPESWEWAAFSDVAQIASNLVDPKQHMTAFHVAPNHIEKGSGRLLDCRTVAEDKVKSSKHQFFAGQILYSKIRPNLSKAVIVDFDGLCSADMYPINPYIDARYLLTFILSPIFLRFAIKTDTRVAMPKINQTALNQIPVAVPPLAEQKRIVSKVDRLMGICDRLESERRETLSLTDRSRRSVLASLTSSRDASELASSWRRLSDHFEILHNRPETLADLRQTTLALAVQGKLVKQDPNDEPAFEAKLEDLLREKSLNGYSKKPGEDENGVPILRISAGTARNDFYVEESDHKWIELTDVEIDKFRLERDDLLACRFNGNLHFVGRFSLYRSCSDTTQVFPDKLIRFRVDLSRLNPRFAVFALNSASSRKKIESFCATTAGNIGISATNLKTIVLRVPPLKEQEKIATKVDRLLAQCDRVAEQLRDRQATTEQLLTATIHQILKTSEDRSQ
ncbi:restriction endonuclease subunit S [Neorhodopirellula lusitana]|nr:restriction endonuclease subunit S [Neorhodopirellula lusitana]